LFVLLKKIIIFCYIVDVIEIDNHD